MQNGTKYLNNNKILLWRVILIIFFTGFIKDLLKLLSVKRWDKEKIKKNQAQGHCFKRLKPEIV